MQIKIVRDTIGRFFQAYQKLFLLFLLLNNETTLHIYAGNKTQNLKVSQNFSEINCET